MKGKIAVIFLGFISPIVLSAQTPPKQAVKIDFPIEILANCYEGLDIELTNNLDTTDETKSITLLCQLGASDSSFELRENSRLNIKDIEAKTVAVIFDDESDSSKRYVRFSTPRWTGYEQAQIILLKTPQPILRIENLPLQPSEYHIRVLDRYDNSEFINEDRQFKAGKYPPIAIKRIGMWDSLKKTLLTEKSFFLSMIVGLFTLLIAVLKDKIKEWFEFLLDVLGRFGSGRLAARRFTRLYIDYVVSQHKYLKLVGFNTAGISRPLLEEVFVSLRIANFSQQLGLGETNTRGELDSERPSLSFANALSQYKRMVILGGPGAGKTTTLSYSILAYAQKKAKEKFGVEEDLLPIFIPLRRLSSENKSILDDLLDKNSQIIPQEQLKDCPVGYFEKKLKKGKCLVLFDGLDEVVNERTYREVASRIDSFVAAYPDNRFIVTCRIAGWQSLLSGDFTVLRTYDFNRSEIQRFILGWHRAVITQSEHSRLQLDIPDKIKFEVVWSEHYHRNVKPAIEMKSRNLLREIDTNSRILTIAVNPMLLSLICLVHYVRNILPRGRTILYSQCLDLLIDAWERQKDIAWHENSTISSIQKEAVLREIAFELQCNGKSEDSRDNLEKLISKILQGVGISMRADELLEEIEQRSGLLTERSIDVFGFSHLTLQEYLVARHIQINPKHAEYLSRNFDKQEWREVILLYAGLLDDATPLIQEIIADNSLERKILAAYSIGDAQHCDETVAGPVVDELLSVMSSAGEASDELVGALSAIATDYGVAPANVREKLSEQLISVLNSSSQTGSTDIIRNFITILGKSRVTKSLPVLVQYLSDPAFNEHAINALASFGDFGIPVLREFIEIEMAKEKRGDNTFFHDRDLRDAEDYLPDISESSQNINDYEIFKPLTPSSSSLLRLFEQINTENSAKLLIKLYEVRSSSVSYFVSFALARMLKNPLIEVELLQIAPSDLPSRVRFLIPDDERFIYEIPHQSAFFHLEKEIRNDISFAIGFTTEYFGLKYPEVGEILQAFSFKILFPAVILGIKDKTTFVPDFSRLDFKIHYDEPEVGWARVLESLGFSNTEDNRLAYLCNQIKKNPTMSVQQALEYRFNDETSKRGKWESVKTNFSLFFGNVVFLVLVFLMVWWAYSVLPEYQRFQFRSGSVYRHFFYLHVIFAPILLYLFLSGFSHIKLKRKIISFQLIDSLVFGYANFHKSLPLITKFKTRYKLIVLNFLFLICSPFLMVLIDFIENFSLAREHTFFWTRLLIFLMPNVFFGVASYLYLNFYVFRINPILQLVRMHPEGERVLGIA